MKVYFDTGLLLKVYSAETNSAQAARLVQSQGTPILLCQLQQIELRNALYRKAGRKEIDRMQLANSLRRIDSDLADGTIEIPEVDWKETWKGADRLTAKYASITQCRTLDVLHVAVAVHLGLKIFATTDARQLIVAKKAGLKLLTLPPTPK